MVCQGRDEFVIWDYGMRGSCEAAEGPQWPQLAALPGEGQQPGGRPAGHGVGTAAGAARGPAQGCGACGRANASDAAGMESGAAGGVACVVLAGRYHPCATSRIIFGFKSPANFVG